MNPLDDKIKTQAHESCQFSHIDLESQNQSILEYSPVDSTHGESVQPAQIELCDCIGSGATSRVFEARNINDDQYVAVKILHEKFIGTTTEERFVREGQLLCRMSHPNLVLGLGMGTNINMSGCSGCPFTVMELLQKQTLLDAMRQNAINTPRALEIALGIARALQYLHMDSRVLSHRDIKPANIMFGKDGTPKLADLGVARTEMVMQHSLQTQLTGTVHYMAPEQLANCQRADIRSDIYSLGIVLAQMLQVEIDRGDERALLQRKFNGAVPQLSLRDAQHLGLSAQAARAYNAVLAKACAYEPYERYQTPADFAATLQELFEYTSEDTPSIYPDIAHPPTLQTQPTTLVSQNASSSKLAPHRLRNRKHTRIALGVSALVLIIVAASLIAASYLGMSQIPADLQHPSQPPTGSEIVIPRGN